MNKIPNDDDHLWRHFRHLLARYDALRTDEQRERFRRRHGYTPVSIQQLRMRVARRRAISRQKDLLPDTPSLDPRTTPRRRTARTRPPRDPRGRTRP